MNQRKIDIVGFLVVAIKAKPKENKINEWKAYFRDVFAFTTIATRSHFRGFCRGIYENFEEFCEFQFWFEPVDFFKEKNENSNEFVRIF